MDHFAEFFSGRASFTEYVTATEDNRAAMRHRNVSDTWPLYPWPGWDEFQLRPVNLPVHSAAVRDPITLMRCWAVAAHRAGRVTDPDAHSHRIIVRADGIADKPFTYHVGLVLAADAKGYSAYSQRDFIIGALSEKNQFMMGFCAGKIGRLASYCRSRGVGLYLNADMTALKNLSRGLCWAPGGFGISDFNQGV